MAMSNDVNTFLRNNPVFEQEINELFKCGICNNIIIDCCTTSCGCDFCRNCILEYFQDTDRPIICPKCKLENIGTDVTNNEWINSKIKTLRVKCSNNSCTHYDTIVNIIEHQKICVMDTLTCPFFNLGCGETEIDGLNGMKIHFGRTIIDHDKLLINEVLRLENDNNITKEKFNNLSNVQENHGNKINEIFLKLEELTNKNRELEHKVNSYERKIEELQTKVGDMERNEMNLREEVEENKRQIRRSEERMNETGNKMEDLNITTGVIGDAIQKVEEDTKTQLDKVSVDVANIKSNHKKNFDNISTETKKLREENKIMKKEMENIDKKMDQERNEVRKEIERKCDDNNKKIIKLETNLNAENEKLWKEIVITSQFVWKLENFDEMEEKLFKNEYMKMESEIFYSHQFGYKFKLRIRGDGIGLRVRFVIVKSKYDEILEWPCRRQIKLALINQDTREDVNEKKFHIDTTEDDEKHVYNRPTESESQEGPGYWINSFFLARQPQILKNDVFFIRCTITP